MYKTVAKIDGMMCSMCESHVNDAIRGKMAVKKISSSHKKGETVIISENEINIEELSSALEGTGYIVLDTETAPCRKKGLFGWK